MPSLFVLILCTYVFLTSFGVDTYHDGIMFGGALAASHGLPPYRGYFAMYGWPISTIQGGFFSVFEPNLVVLRGGSAVLLGASFALLGLTWIRTYGKRISIAATLLAFLLTPFFSHHFDVLPWNSDLILFLQALLLFLLRDQTLSFVGSRGWIFLSAASGLLSLVIWSRLTVGLVTTLLISIVLLISRNWKLVGAFWITMLLFNGIFLVWLIETGSLSAFVDQYYRFPREAFLVNRGPHAGIEILIGVMVSIPLALLAGAWQIGRKLKFQVSVPVIRVSAIVASGITLTYRFLSFPLDPRYLATRIFQETALFAIVILGSLISLSRIVKFFRRRSERRSSDFANAIRAAIVAGALVQIFPQPDWYHLWWAALPAMASVIATYFPNQSSARSSDRFALRAVCAVALVLAVFSLTIKFTRSYVDASEISILSGSKMNSRQYEEIIPTMAALQKVQANVGSRSVVNICSMGLYIGLGKQVDFVSPYFVSWEWGRGVGVSLRAPRTLSFLREKSPFVVYCPLRGYDWGKDSADLFQPLAPLGYSLLRVESCNKPSWKFRVSPYDLAVAVPKRQVDEFKFTSSQSKDFCTKVLTLRD